MVIDRAGKEAEKDVTQVAPSLIKKNIEYALAVERIV